MCRKIFSLKRPLCHELHSKKIAFLLLFSPIHCIYINHLRINLGLQATYMEMGSVLKFRSIYQLCVETISARHTPSAMSYAIRQLAFLLLFSPIHCIYINHLRINLGLQATYMEMGSVLKFRSIYQLWVEKISA